MNADEYEGLVERLADDVVAALHDDEGERIEGADEDDTAARASGDHEDALWSAVGSFVPRMEAPVCEAILAHAGAEPLEALVEEVVAMRESDDAERLRAEAFTVLLQDVNVRVAARGGYQ